MSSSRNSQRSDEERLLQKDATPPIPLRNLVGDKPANNINDVQDAQLTFSTPTRRFLKHETVLLIAPLTITAYFIFIWQKYLTRDKEEPLKYGSAREIWVNYSWFLILVFGLSLAKYGVVGVEAAMLQVRIWRLPNTTAYLMHSDSSWNSPEEWIKVLFAWFKNLVLSHHVRNGSLHRLWGILALFSLFPFMAFTLVGLSFELSDGFVYSSEPAIVIGHTWDDYHIRPSYGEKISTAAERAWQAGAHPQLPGIGVIYTPSYLERRKYSGLDQLPNALPLDGGIPEIFVTQQATSAISGNAWGLHTGYNCSALEDISELTILTQTLMEEYSGNKTYVTASGQGIYSWDTFGGTQSVNIRAYVEMGLTSSSKATFYDGTEPSSFSVRDTSKADIIEYVVWQIRYEAAYGDAGRAFNDTLRPTVKGLGSPFTQLANKTVAVNDTFFESRGRKPYDISFSSFSPLSIASPVGVRCRAVSALGTAQIDPWSATFKNFTKSPPSPWNQSLVEERAPRFGSIAKDVLLNKFVEIFASANTRPSIGDSNSDRYDSFMQPQTVKKSMLMAYAMDALQLMYDGTYGFDGAWENKNLTSSTPGKVLTAGVVPPIVPAICFSVWAVVSLILCALYGFRRRWSESVDGDSVFWRGVELADKAKSGLAEGQDRDTVLKQLPGSVH